MSCVYMKQSHVLARAFMASLGSIHRLPIAQRDTGLDRQSTHLRRLLATSSVLPSASLQSSESLNGRIPVQTDDILRPSTSDHPRHSRSSSSSYGEVNDLRLSSKQGRKGVPWQSSPLRHFSAADLAINDLWKEEINLNPQPHSRDYERPPTPVPWHLSRDGEETSHQRMSGFAGLWLEPRAQAGAALIFLPGLGQSAEEFCSELGVEYGVAPHLQTLRIIIPDPPRRPAAACHSLSLRRPAHLAAGETNAWFETEGHANRADERCRGMEESLQMIKGIINEQIDSGIPVENIILAGYSQGGAMALLTAVNTPLQLGGLFVVNGYLPGLRRYPQMVKGRIQYPMLFCHGAGNSHVHIQDGWRAFQVMYTGSQAEVHKEKAQSLRARWTYAPVPCPMTALMEGEIEDDSEDIGHLSLRTGDCRTPAASSAPCSGLHAQTCPARTKRDSPIYGGMCLLGGRLTSFVTFNTFSHHASPEVVHLLIHWLDHLSSIGGWSDTAKLENVDPNQFGMC